MFCKGSSLYFEHTSKGGLGSVMGKGGLRLSAIFECLPEGALFSGACAEATAAAGVCPR